jgi:hypothetical protein
MRISVHFWVSRMLNQPVELTEEANIAATSSSPTLGVSVAAMICCNRSGETGDRLLEWIPLEQWCQGVHDR